MSDFLAIITVQLRSERLPNKGMASVAGKPLLEWLIERISDPSPPGIGARVVVATPADSANDPVEALCKRLDVPCHRRGSDRDVVGEMDAVVKAYPRTKFVARILADCPFISTEIVRRSVHCLRRYDRELFLYYQPSWYWPVYPAQIFAMSIGAWRKIALNATGEEREHPDLWLNRHRDQFRILYHEGPSGWLYRSPDKIRLEVDHPEDLEMVRAVATRGPGMLAPLDKVLKWLDENEDACRNAKLYKEKTGPTVSYSNSLQRQWYRLMAQADLVVTWEGQELRPLRDKRATQVYCQSGECLLGWGLDGVLHTVGGDVINQAGRLSCKCGAGGRWHKAIGRDR